MLAKKNSSSQFLGSPNFIHSDKIESKYEKALISAIPDFIYELKNNTKEGNFNEGDFSQAYIIALNRYLINNQEGIMAIPEYRDYSPGADPIKRVDIAFIPSEQRATTIKFYTVEAKRLPTGKGKREREYVFGHFKSGAPSGGIQRFKTGDHGYGLSQSAIIGYIEENTFTYWHNTINSWITDKATESPNRWNENEQLQNLKIDKDQSCSMSRSVAYREKSNAIKLFHLWIKIL